MPAGQRARAIDSARLRCAPFAAENAAERAPALRDADQVLECGCEFRRVHVIRVGAETFDAPAGVQRIGTSAPPAAQILHPGVRNPRGGKRALELLAAELRIAARARKRTDVDELRDAVRTQRVDELLERAVAVADRMNPAAVARHARSMLEAPQRSKEERP